MGLLDDAIREHLELKRRRGADPAEVARAEQEALGPVRREPEPAQVQDSVHEEPHDALPREPADVAAEAPSAPHEPLPLEHDHEHAEPLHELAPEEQTRILPPEQRAAPPASAPAEPAHREPAQEPAFPDEHAQAEPPPHAERAVHEQPPAETSTPPHGDPIHDEPAVDPRHSDIVHQPTTEWRIEDEDEPFSEDPGDPAAGQASDEDVLEETPDFLQETPEHDRLWFEQRPPRDFDFDD
jgi:hypothetical protein